MPDFDSDDWQLVGSVSHGIGRAWLARCHGLSDNPVDDATNMAASTKAGALRWLREQLDAERGSRVPVRLDDRDQWLVFVYVSRRYVPADEWSQHWAEQEES